MLLAAREAGRAPRRLRGQRIALDREPSGINAAVREGTAFAVYDAESSEVVNRRLNKIAKAKSCVFIPVRAQEQVVGVSSARFAVCPRRTSCADAGAREQPAWRSSARARRPHSACALERERLIAQISLELRSRRDVDEVLPAVLGEVNARRDQVLRPARRAGRDDLGRRGVECRGCHPLGDAVRLPVANLAARTGRTVAVADVLDAPELSDAALGDVRELTRGGASAPSSPRRS